MYMLILKKSYWLCRHLIEQASPLRMELHGLQGLREQQFISKEPPTETDSSYRWVIQEPSSLHLMEPHGITGLLEHQKISK